MAAHHGQPEQTRERLDAEGIEIGDWSWRDAGHREGALTGVAVVTLTFTPPLRGLEVVVEGPDQRLPLQTVILAMIAPARQA